jgi:hypothetical protein
VNIRPDRVGIIRHAIFMVNLQSRIPPGHEFIHRIQEFVPRFEWNIWIHRPGGQKLLEGLVAPPAAGEGRFPVL